MPPAKAPSTLQEEGSRDGDRNKFLASLAAVRVIHPTVHPRTSTETAAWVPLS